MGRPPAAAAAGLQRWAAATTLGAVAALSQPRPAPAAPTAPTAASAPCYVDVLFTAEQIDVLEDVEFGSAWNNLTRSEQVLTLDAYLPPGGPVPAQHAAGAHRRVTQPAAGRGCLAALDVACGPDKGDVFTCAQCAGVHQHTLQRAGCSNDDIAAWCSGISPPPGPPPAGPARPVVVLIHGGSFETGDSRSDDMPAFAMEFATRGYVVVSINYRLEAEFFGLDTLTAALKAQEDARAAVRFVRSKAEDYHLDPQRIVVGGDSAGAITSLVLGYLKEGTEGSSGNPGFSSQVNVTVAISGMLGGKGFCDGTHGPPDYMPYGCQVDNSWDYTTEIGARQPQPALAIVSGTSDLTTPYYFALEATNRATATGLPHTLITVPGGGHVPFEQLFASKKWMLQLFSFIATQLQLTPPCPTDTNGEEEEVTQ